MVNSNQGNGGDWDLEIDASNSKKALGLKGISSYRDLIFIFTRRDFATTFKQSVLGPFWLLLQPILKVTIFYVVFGRLMKISTDGINPILFYLTGLTFWEFFASNVKKVSGSLLVNQHLLGKVYFNRMVIPLSMMLSNLVRNSLQLILLAIVWIYFALKGEVQLHLALLLIPILILVISMLGAGLGMILASITTVYRDIQFVIESGLQLLFYLTPVIYPISLLGGSVEKLYWLNPMVAMLETVNYSLLGISRINFSALGLATAFSILVFVVGTIKYQTASRNFVDRV